MHRWDERYARGDHPGAEPTELLVGIVETLLPGRALDLACGTGRHLLHLAKFGWDVVGVDSSRIGIAIAKRRLAELDLTAELFVADLEKKEFTLEPDSFDLIIDFFYLQRNLFSAIRKSVKPGGLFVAAIHLRSENPEDDLGRRTMFMLNSGELHSLFDDWEIISYNETPPTEIVRSARRRRCAEIVARKPR